MQRAFILLRCCLNPLGRALPSLADSTLQGRGGGSVQGHPSLLTFIRGWHRVVILGCPQAVVGVGGCRAGLWFLVAAAVFSCLPATWLPGCCCSPNKVLGSILCLVVVLGRVRSVSVHGRVGPLVYRSICLVGGCALACFELLVTLL